MQTLEEIGSGSSLVLALYGFITVAFGAAVVIHFKKSKATLNLNLCTCMHLLLLFFGLFLSYSYLPQYTGVVFFGLCCYTVFRTIRSNAILSPQGKAVLITGCDLGFGHTLAKRLHSLGFHVFATVLHEDGDGARVLKSFGSDRLMVIQMDVTNWAMVQEVEKKIGKQLENKGLYALVNNAGIISCVGDAEIIPTNAFKQCMEVNFLGVVEVTKTFLPLIRRAKGRIINLSSPSGELPFGRLSPYSTSKAALELFADILRQEMKPWEVQISIIQPGATKTGQVGNAEVWEQDYGKLVENLSPALLRDYGEEYFAELKQAILTIGPLFRQHVDPVIETIVTALLVQHPKPRYTTEYIVDVLKILYYFLPSFMSDVILNEVFIAHKLLPKGVRSSNISQ
ncbi:11-beta-hydroxysteroid dehydrogenase type 2-like isoform X1 [Pristis pectinata]|uniref:11-beta-hydroxysteroid dehydrogenase type 2-like isoform X1 n=1 Tax=Pristis pectinata TaxID=685728 RepID=UPI00223D8A86|nr:11-beta-hydroxysteroid dehydrogenase type 2-like isoform X1 [Pristis pectinata]